MYISLCYYGQLAGKAKPCPLMGKYSQYPISAGLTILTILFTMLTHEEVLNMLRTQNRDQCEWCIVGVWRHDVSSVSPPLVSSQRGGAFNVCTCFYHSSEYLHRLETKLLHVGKPQRLTFINKKTLLLLKHYLFTNIPRIFTNTQYFVVKSEPLWNLYHDIKEMSITFTGGTGRQDSLECYILKIIICHFLQQSLN